MMKLDRGNKDQSPHKKVRSNHELDFRKNRILFTSLFTMIPALLFLVFWSDREDLNKRSWEFTILTIGSGLILLGCLYIMFSLLILNKDTRSNNIIASSLLIFGGLLYWIGTIGIVEDLSDNGNKLFDGSGCSSGNRCNVLNHLGNSEDRFRNDGLNVRDSIYWFGLLSLIGWDALMLGIDIISDLFFAQYLRISLWSFPLLFASSFAWSVMLIYSKKDLNWWELTGKAGFGTIAIANLFLVLLSCMKYLIKSLGTFLSLCSFLGSIAIWVYHGAYLAGDNVNDASSACYYIGIPFLISGQSLFLMYDCLLGTKEPKDGAAAHTVPKREQNNEYNVRGDARV